MALHGPRLVVPIDVKKKPWEQKHPLQNRWHTDIPSVAEVRGGEVFRVEMADFSSGGITHDYPADDIRHADLSIVHLLLSCCPCERRISGIVDFPNVVAALAIPTSIFDQDICPKRNKMPVCPEFAELQMC